MVRPVESSSEKTGAIADSLDLMSQGGLHALARQEPERFDALEQAGFKTERYGSLTHHLYNRMGGHYSE